MDKLGLQPGPDDIVIRATAVIDRIDDLSTLNGQQLHEFWPGVVASTHIDMGNPHLKVNPSIFYPLDLNKFLAIRCRAVSAGEVHGMNSNGDYFPMQDLVQSHKSLIGKGFYIEHRSNDPRNAVGIIAHAEWVPKHNYVVAVALVDKERFPGEAAMIRTALKNGRAGVSIGCVAGTAECSVCHRVARRLSDVCSCMNRTSPFCVKGRKMPTGQFAYDICMDLTFYELSFTMCPADRDALPYVVLGAEEKPVDPPVGEPKVVTIPNEAEITRMVSKEMEQTVKSFTHQLIKSQIDRYLAEEFRNMQQDMKPMIKKLVKEFSIVK